MTDPELLALIVEYGQKMAAGAQTEAYGAADRVYTRIIAEIRHRRARMNRAGMIHR